MLPQTIRALLRSPGVSGVAVLSLALGIGANTAIFSFLDTIVLRSLPVRSPDRLVALGFPLQRGGTGTRFSYPFWRAISDLRCFDGITAHTDWRAYLDSDGEPQRVSIELVTGNHFAVLGAATMLGRSIVPADETTAEPAVVLAHGFWERRLGRDPSIIGRTIALNRRQFTVIGVAHPRFFGTTVGEAPDLWAPITVLEQLYPGNGQLARPRTRWLELIARLAPGIERPQAEAALNGAAKSLPADLRPERLVLLPAAKGLSWLREQYAKPLAVLMGGVGLLLAIACANVANLLLARGLARRREIAIRLALGAGRARMIRQLVAEALVLAVTGGIAGLALAAAGTRVLAAFIPPRFAVEVHPDLRVFAFALAVSIAAAMASGVVPAIQATRPDLVAGLKGDPRAGGTGRAGVRRALLLVQMALSVLLVAGAALLVRTLWKLRAVDLGFSQSGIAVATIENASPAFFDRLRERLEAQPGVAATAVASYGALSGGERNETVGLPGSAEESADRFNVVVNTISSRYFETLGIPLVAGRDFGPRDSSTSAILSETAARFLFGAENAVGRRIVLRWVPAEAEVIGVVKDARYRSLRDEHRRILYLPRGARDGRLLYLRAANLPAAMASVRAEARALDRRVPVPSVRTVASDIDASLRQERLLATVSASFGGVALVLAAVGIYGVFAWQVARRAREIGIRMALGAVRHRVLARVLGEAALFAAAGVALGLPAALAAGRVMESFLYGVKTADPVSLAAAAALLVVAAIAAGLRPALRAASVDPAIALRDE